MTTREMGIEDARAKLGDLVRDAQQHGMSTRITRNGKPAAILIPDSGTIQEGAKVRLIDPPGTKVPYGAVGTAEEAPGTGGLFWAQFPQGRMHTRTSEVEIVDEPEREGS